MNEEDNIEQPEVPETPEQVEVDPVEQSAREQGWLPKEDYSGDPAKWVSAETFVARAPLFEKIEELNRKIRSLDQGNKALTKHYQDMRKVEYDRAVQDLRIQHRLKLEEGDLIGADEIKDQIQEVREQAKHATQVDNTQPPEPTPEFSAWLSENRWYATNQDLRDAADSVGLKYHKQGLPPSEVLKKVSDHIKKVFPDEFRNPNKEKASAVEGKTATTKVTAKASVEDTMTADEKRIMQRVIKTAGISKEQYLKDYEAIKGV